MKFIVLGVDSQSGQEMKLQLEAPDAREAHRIAHEKGIMVSRVVTVTEGAAAPGTVEAGAERPAAAKPAQQGKQVIPAGPPITHFYTKVAGVTFRNFDGSSRQDVVKKCKVLDSVTLKYEEGGKDIERAVGVYSAGGEQMGRLGPEPTAKVSALMKSGFRIFAFVSKLTGGHVLHPVREAEIVIVQARPGITTEAVQRYVDSVQI
jgi:hypothetical protein